MLRNGRIRLKRISEDKYAWLENAQDPRVVKWALEQDRIARKQVRKYSDILYKRMVPFYKRPVMRSVQLTKQGIILFLSDHKSYKVQLLHKNGRRELLADSNKLGKDVVIQGVQARDDGKRLALHYSTGGSDEATIRILDLETGDALDTLHGFVGNILWLPDESYYLTKPRGRKNPPTESSRQQTESTTGSMERTRWFSAKDSQQTRSSNSSNHETDRRHFSTSTRDSHGADPTPD